MDGHGSAASSSAAQRDGAAGAGAVQEQRRKELLRNFALMSLYFSLNHACVVAVLVLSTANLGPGLGNISNAALYLFYVGSALLFAGPHVKRRGPKRALVDATLAFCVYIGSFFVAEVWSAGAWVAAPGGAAVGGLAAGVLFTAQGSYFTLTARSYAGGEAEGAAMEGATSLLGGIFAAIYLCCEIFFKLVASALPLYWSAGWLVVSAAYFVAAVLAALAMVSCSRPLPPGLPAIACPVSRPAPTPVLSVCLSTCCWALRCRCLRRRRSTTQRCKACPQTRRPPTPAAPRQKPTAPRRRQGARRRQDRRQREEKRWVGALGGRR